MSYENGIILIVTLALALATAFLIWLVSRSSVRLHNRMMEVEGSLEEARERVDSLDLRLDDVEIRCEKFEDIQLLHESRFNARK